MLSKPKSTKVKIVSILSEEWPLTAKEIYSRIGKQGSITYQAVFKEVKHLLEEGILEEKEKKYSISKNWVDSEFTQISNLRMALKGIDLPATTLHFNSLFEVDKFLFGAAESISDPGQKKDLFMFWHHFWIPLFLSRKEYSSAKETILKFKSHPVTPANTPLDRWCAEFWTKHGSNIHTFVKGNNFCDVAVVDDIVLSVYYPESIRKELDDFFNSVESISDMKYGKLIKIFEKKVDIPVTVIIDQKIADILKAKIKAIAK